MAFFSTYPLGCVLSSGYLYSKQQNLRPEKSYKSLPYMQNTILQDIYTSQLGGFSVFFGGEEGWGGLGAVGGFTTQKYPLRKRIVKTFSTLTLA